MSESRVYTLDEIAETVGIERRGDHAVHCGEQMEVRGGLIGPDYARCHVCGLEIGDTRSPHISGWIVMEEVDSEVDSNRTWVVLSEEATP